MSRLPAVIADALSRVSHEDGKPDALAGAVSGLLEMERRFEALVRGIEAFREAARGLGILEEARNGQNICDAWAKLSRFFLAPLLQGTAVVSGKGGDLREAPKGFEALAARWERVIPEVEKFVEEEKSMDRAFAEAPVSAHVGYRLRSQLLVLDRRAERIKVGLDLVRRDLAAAAREGVDHLVHRLGGRR